MKRIISLLLIFTIIASAMYSFVQADSVSTGLTDDEIYSMHEHFVSLQTRLEGNFSVDTSIAYWNYIHACANVPEWQNLVEFSGLCIGEKMDTEYYIEVLTSIMALSEYSLSDSIRMQYQYRDVKDEGDYIIDVLSILSGLVGISPEASKKAKNVSSLLGSGKNIVLANQEHLEYYTLTIQSYANSYNFLNAIVKYTNNEKLKEAANLLLRLNDTLLDERLKYLVDTGGDILKEGVEAHLPNFIKNSYNRLKDSKLLKGNKLLSGACELLVLNIDNALSYGKLVFESLILLGDAYFGTTNTFKRYNEMSALADISDALVKACKEIEINPDDSNITLCNNMYQKLYLYKLLLHIHTRGEQAMYSLSVKDARGLSACVKFVESHNNFTTRDEWFRNQTDWFKEYYEEIEEMLTPPPKTVVQEGFKLYNGFIIPVNQKTEVPEGYIGIYSYEDFKGMYEKNTATGFTSQGYLYSYKNDLNYILMNDITFPADYESEGEFYGIFDGNGYTISNVSSPLFKEICDATIKNLGINVSYSFSSNNECVYGAIAQRSKFGQLQDTHIDNCFVKGKISITCNGGRIGALIGDSQRTYMSNCYSETNITVSTSYTAEVGGISGNSVTLFNCLNTGNISVTTTSGSLSVGGICGKIDPVAYSSATSYDGALNCFNSGEITAIVTGDNDAYVGGICGENNGLYIAGFMYTACIQGCTNRGTVKQLRNGALTAPLGTDNIGAAGGIAGISLAPSQITECQNEGQVVANEIAGGIVGFISDDYSSDRPTNSVSDCYNTSEVSGASYSGGVIGYSEPHATISNCFNLGAVSGDTFVGAFAGHLSPNEENSDAVNNCYYLKCNLTSVSSGVTYSEISSISEKEFAKQKTFDGFDFAEVWKMTEEDAHPMLRFNTPVDKLKNND